MSRRLPELLEPGIRGLMKSRNEAVNALARVTAERDEARRQRSDAMTPDNPCRALARLDLSPEAEQLHRDNLRRLLAHNLWSPPKPWWVRAWTWVWHP